MDLDVYMVKEDMSWEPETLKTLTPRRFSMKPKTEEAGTSRCKCATGPQPLK